MARNGRPVYRTDAGLVLYYNQEAFVVMDPNQNLGEMQELTGSQGNYPTTGTFSAEVPYGSGVYVDAQVSISCADNNFGESGKNIKFCRKMIHIPV